MDQQAEVLVEPESILSRDLKPLEDWREWLERWGAAKHFSELESLLHVGFSIPIASGSHKRKNYGEADRIGFYLSIADGWGYYNPNALRKPGDMSYSVRGENSSWQNKPVSEFRKDIARKAMAQLCQNFFKIELSDRSGRSHSDWELVTSERLLPFIRHFFRLEDTRELERYRAIPNLRGGDSENRLTETAKGFLQNLAIYIWTWKEISLDDCREEDWYKKRVEEEKVKRLRIDAAKPWLLDVMTNLGQLEVLEGFTNTFDTRVVDRLREIAMQARIGGYLYRGREWIRDERAVQTVEEAYYVGSGAARLLKHWEIVAAEEKRLRDIFEANEALEDAKRRVEELGGQK